MPHTIGDTTLYDDGIIRTWDVYSQQWITRDPRLIRDETLAALPEPERRLIISAQDRYSETARQALAYHSVAERCRASITRTTFPLL